MAKYNAHAHRAQQLPVAADIQSDPAKIAAKSGVKGFQGRDPLLDSIITKIGEALEPLAMAQFRKTGTTSAVSTEELLTSMAPHNKKSLVEVLRTYLARADYTEQGAVGVRIVNMNGTPGKPGNPKVPHLKALLSKPNEFGILRDDGGTFRGIPEDKFFDAGPDDMPSSPTA